MGRRQWRKQLRSSRQLRLVNERVAVLTKNKDLDASKQIEEVVKEPKSVLIEKDDDFGVLDSEKCLNEQIQKRIYSILTEKDDLSAQILEVVQEPNSTSID
ncbi:hypothetical protein L2E82_05124 [Cichorium intybus]|uniref:Uncharacterized protein n=1 Tax=Cichorium intybus TaxID=13427 RepID=A0ACB9H742_CICIN|nr:hypothetical protein L2E82_05124 [Cichorium intybus]